MNTSEPGAADNAWGPTRVAPLLGIDRASASSGLLPFGIAAEDQAKLYRAKETWNKANWNQSDTEGRGVWWESSHRAVGELFSALIIVVR